MVKVSGDHVSLTRNEAKQRLYSVYAETMGHNPVRLEQAISQYDHFWRDLLPSDRNTPMLDLGCGDGFFLLFLKRAGFTSLSGVDVSPDQVTVARSYGLDVTCGNALEYVRNCESQFGVINAQNIFEHLTLEELFQFLDAIRTALRPGGELWVVVPNALSPLGSSVRYGDMTHETCFTPQSLIQVLRVCGFDDFRVREIGAPIVHGIKSLVRFALWKVIRSALYIWRLVEFGETGPAAVFTHDMQAVARKR